MYIYIRSFNVNLDNKIFLIISFSRGGKVSEIIIASFLQAGNTCPYLTLS